MRLLSWALTASLTLGLGCSSVVRQAPGLPPTPETITRDEPGGDAHDPHLAALLRLGSEPWGFRTDRQSSLRIPMPDDRNWRRVKFFGMPTFAAFRYGDAHHAVIAVWVRAIEEGEADDLESCLDRFEKWGEPKARSFGVKLESPASAQARWHRGEVVIRSVDARIESWFSKKRFSAAYAAYRMWPGSCTVVGIAVASQGAEEEARRARDRYVNEGFGRLVQPSSKPPPR